MLLSSYNNNYDYIHKYSNTVENRLATIIQA